MEKGFTRPSVSIPIRVKYFLLFLPLSMWIWPLGGNAFCVTGLKQALATVNDYNPLMKDFPINDLLSATELDRIRTALQQIFGHLRKIRSTKYPMQRALRLVEAISKDLNTQLLKVGSETLY